ncbi:unnamed protein product [Moneuplotes crassus]|uniref:folate gamma-glutamyl hydrolase n=1 Tax=Euplotes crassus TaxID=5936 RepID=A0AAD2D079_EUPCR|nr:unnamed protein product [Moneuplotes crassus]
MITKIVAFIVLNLVVTLVTASYLESGGVKKFINTLIEYVTSEDFDQENPDQKTNLRPIIGIVAKPAINKSPYTTFIMAAYSKYAQSSGARVVPIPYDLSDEEIQFRMEGINGLILPGGADWLMEKNNTFTKYTSKVKLMIDHAKRMNDEGIYFPVLGICLGFEQLILFEEPVYEIFGEFDSRDFPTSLKFEVDAKSTKMFQNIDVSQVKDKNLTYHHHFRGFNVSLFTDTPSIKEAYRITSTSSDRIGQKFVSSVEHYNYPFYGLQFHPEKPSYIWIKDKNIPHSPEAIKFSQDLIINFVKECRKNFNAFESRKIENKLMIENAFLNLTLTTSQDIYLF